AWIWLDVALCAHPQLAAASADDAALLHGKLAACTYFFHYELPKIGAWLQVVESRDATCRSMDEAWF
ncbi:MAG TPA: acyl-CoA dehydrogenase C-terminal domain-containing protein, partial [Burkholderiaceae bacterium]